MREEETGSLKLRSIALVLSNTRRVGPRNKKAIEDTNKSTQRVVRVTQSWEE